MQTFRANDKTTGEPIEVNLDLQPLRERAEANAGDPIRAMVKIVADELTTRGASVGESNRRRLHKVFSKALAREHWPAVVDLSDGKQVPADSGADRRSDQGAYDSSREPDGPGIFEKELFYPDDGAKRVYESLVGVDDKKANLLLEAELLVQPNRLKEWSRKHHSKDIQACAELEDRKPFIVFAGDVGTGKTALAESFGDALARQLEVQVALLRLSVQSRGTGLVGEMTSLISDAFQLALNRAVRFDGITILLLDEADALASSRENQQMHHEDRAGVNALIQGVDRVADSSELVLVIFCTNRPNSLDPAIRRRAADMFQFTRPNEAQRRALLEALLGDVELDNGVLGQIISLTGRGEHRSYGYTYSDIRTRLVPNALREAYREDSPLTGEILIDQVRNMDPTPPFTSQDYD